MPENEEPPAGREGYFLWILIFVLTKFSTNNILFRAGFMKRCIYCGRILKDNDYKCPFCNHYTNQTIDIDSHNNYSSQCIYNKIGIVGFIFACISLLFLFVPILSMLLSIVATIISGAALSRICFYNSCNLLAVFGLAISVGVGFFLIYVLNLASLME